MSANICPVVRLGESQPIEKADRLVCFNMLGSGPVVVSKEDFSAGDLAVFIPPESLVDTGDSRFSFLAPRARKSDGMMKVRPMRLRGQMSIGLLMPPGNLKEGDNGADLYRVKKFEEPVTVETAAKRRTLWRRIKGWLFRPPSVPKGLWPGIPVYDINQLYKMPRDIFGEDELIEATEKLHGTNARFCIGKDGKLWIGSRTIWRQHDGKNVYSRAALSCDVESKLRRLSEPMVLWGEIVGPQIQKGFDYGLSGSDLKFYAFDIYHATQRRFLDPDETKNICHWLHIPTVPILRIEPWKDMRKSLDILASTKTQWPNHPSEGIVVRPWQNVSETHALDGSKCLVAGKIINPEYLEFREKPGMDEQIIL